MYIYIYIYIHIIHTYIPSRSFPCIRKQSSTIWSYYQVRPLRQSESHPSSESNNFGSLFRIKSTAKKSTRCKLNSTFYVGEKDLKTSRFRFDSPLGGDQPINQRFPRSVVGVEEVDPRFRVRGHHSCTVPEGVKATALRMVQWRRSNNLRQKSAEERCRLRLSCKSSIIYKT